MKQLTNFTLSGLNSLVEFKDEISINGTLYSKSTLQSLGINNTETYADTNNLGEMVLERSMNNQAELYHTSQRINSVLVDSKNSNIVYTIRATDGASMYCMFQKWEKTGTSYIKKAELRWGSAGDGNYYKPQFHTYQNEKYLYAWSPRWSSGAYSGYFWRVDKETWTSTHSYNIATSPTVYFCGPQPIYEDTNNMYYWLPSNAGNAIYGGLVWCAKHMNATDNPFNGVYTGACFEGGSYPTKLIPEFTATSSRQLATSTAIAFDNPKSFYYLCFTETNDKTGFTPHILMLTLKPELNKISDTVVTKTILNPKNYNLELGPGTLQLEYANLMNTFYNIDTFTSDNHKYIVVYNHNRTGTAATSSITQSKYFKIIVFEDIGNDELEVKSVTQAPLLPYGALLSKNHTRLVLYGLDQLYNCVWNQETEAFEYGNPINLTVYQIGFDNDSKFWALDTTKKLYIEDLSVADRISIEFIDVPDFDRFDLTPYGMLKITQKNMNGLPISSKVNIKLNGAVYFVDGSSSKNVMIDDTGIIEMQVKFGEATSYEAIVTQIYK